MSPLLLAILGYLVLQFGIGVWASKRVRSEADYLLAGRSLGYPLATFSFFATWFGAETVMGSAGTAYGQGVSLANAEPFGYGLCLVGMGVIFARPLWRRQLTTLADLFVARYAVSVERVAAAILIPSSILWAAAQVRAFGQVLSLAGAFELEAAIALATGFTILYTVFGGLLADAVTDLIQGGIVILGLLVVAVAVVVALPEGTTVMGALTAPGAITLRPPDDVTWLALVEEWSIPVCGSLIATELVGRVVASRSEQVASRSALMAGGMYVAVGLIPLLIGLIGREVVAPLADAEQVVPAVAQQLLPPVLFVVFIGGLLSAILSTVDSTLLVSSGLLSHNLIVPVFGIVDERRKVLVARLGVASFGVIAYALAVRADGVFALVEQASAFGSSGVLVVVVFALFTTWGGVRTAMATLLVGLVSYLAGAFGGIEAPFVSSLLLSLLTYLAGSVLEGRRAPVPLTER